jgi:acyl dehydratase
MAVTTFDGIDAVRTAVGTHLGFSDWTTVTQEQVNTFAEATGDFQWIHVDVERANAESPFGGPIAHGYLTVSLTNLFLPQVVDVQGISAGLNRGTGKIRFPAPVPVGSRLRGGVELVAVDDVVRGGVVTGIDTTMIITVEREGGDKPVCVVESLSRYLS